MRSAREFLRGLVDTAHPLLVQIIPIRHCNIDCGYCNGYDKVVTAGPDRRDDGAHRQAQGARHSVVAFSGGEPMLHPDLDDLSAASAARHDGGPHHQRLLPRAQAHRAVNKAGLDFLQISIDNVEPDEVTKKSLRVLDKKLQHLRDHATFDVNINSVLGGGIKNPEDARTINQRARELGFSTSVGIIHDG